MSGVLHRLAQLVHRESGLVLDTTKHPSLAAALARAAPGTEAESFVESAGSDGIARLIDELTIKETSFLRDRRQLASIEWQAHGLSARQAGSDRVRVWSAACATGEEPYSLALLACEAFGTDTPPVEILATDIARTALAAAERGLYRERSLQALDVEARERHFTHEDDRLAVSQHLRRLVRFERHNLVRDPIPPLGHGPFDLVLCRNVLIYFDPETVEHITAALAASLAPGGRLVLGAAHALSDTTRRLARLTSTAGSSATLPRRQRASRELRRPLGRMAEEAVAEAGSDTLDPDAHFLHGLAGLEGGDAASAIPALRRALYLDPGFALAAFVLGRAHELNGEPAPARRAYERSLTSLEEENERDQRLLAQIDVADVAAACVARIAALTPEYRRSA